MNTVFCYRCVHLISYNQTNGAENETEETTLTLSPNMTLVFTDIQADANALQVLCRLSCQGQEGQRDNLAAPRAQRIYFRSAGSFSSHPAFFSDSAPHPGQTTEKRGFFLATAAILF